MIGDSLRRLNRNLMERPAQYRPERSSVVVQSSTEWYGHAEVGTTTTNGRHSETRDGAGTVYYPTLKRSSTLILQPALAILKTINF